MFAVVSLGNSQFKVVEGDTITANRLDLKVGEKITLDKVLLISDGDKITVGQPFIKAATVSAQVIDHPRGAKVIAFKYRKRKDSARTHGHRQDLTSVKIEKISL